MASACNLRFAGDSSAPKTQAFEMATFASFFENMQVHWKWMEGYCKEEYSDSPLDELSYGEAERIDAASGPLASVNEKKRKKCAKGCMRLKEMLEEKAWLQKATFLSRRPVGLADLNVGVIKRFIDLIYESSNDQIMDSLHLPVSSLKFLVGNRWLSRQKLLKSGLINCEDERCQEEMATAWQSGMNERKCSHLMLVYNPFYPQPFTLNEDKLIELASSVTSLTAFYPHILITDVNRKIAFRYTPPAENDLNEDDADEVDSQKFWDDVAMEIMFKKTRLSKNGSESVILGTSFRLKE
eukprot:gene17055-8571_t